jgi:hypothetical protein
MIPSEIFSRYDDTEELDLEEDEEENPLQMEFEIEQRRAEVLRWFEQGRNNAREQVRYN